MLAQLLADRPHVLLDFDGPVCAVFGGTTAPAIARQLAHTVASRGIHVPKDVENSGDPFDILRYVGRTNPDAAPETERALTHLEVQAVATAVMTPGLIDALGALDHSGHGITIVSNNSADAVRTFLATRNLTARIRTVAGRTTCDPTLLKPHPHLVNVAIRGLNTDPAQCVLIGDSVTDTKAARAAGVAVIAFVNEPGKHDRLSASKPDAIIHRLADITRAVTR